MNIENGWEPKDFDKSFCYKVMVSNKIEEFLALQFIIDLFISTIIFQRVFRTDINKNDSSSRFKIQLINNVHLNRSLGSIEKFV